MNLCNIWNKLSAYNFQKTKVESFPYITAIEITNACIMKCRMCPRKYMKRKVGFMNINLFEKIISQLEYNVGKKINLHHFGDPLLHPKMEKMIGLCNKYKLKPCLSTNPQLLSNKNINSILNSKLDYLHLSLDGATKKTYENLRGGKADYKKAVKCINNFLKEKVKRKLKLPHTQIAIITMKETKKEIEKFKKKWNKPGIDEVQIKPFIRWDGAIEEINSLAENNQLAKKGERNFPCYWAWSRLVVLWDGRVVPCCYDYDGKVILGDLKKQSLKEIWNGKRMQKFRKNQINNTFLENHLCKQCNEKEGIKPSKFYPLNILFQKNLNIIPYLKYN